MMPPVKRSRRLPNNTWPQVLAEWNRRNPDEQSTMMALVMRERRHDPAVLEVVADVLCRIDTERAKREQLAQAQIKRMEVQA